MARNSHVIKIKLGSDEHRMVKNEDDSNYCQQCSMKSVCFDMGQTTRQNFCDAVIQDVFDYPREAMPYGGHFEMKES